jgi:hypothetical protein
MTGFIFIIKLYFNVLFKSVITRIVVYTGSNNCENVYIIICKTVLNLFVQS